MLAPAACGCVRGSMCQVGAERGLTLHSRSIVDVVPDGTASRLWPRLVAGSHLAAPSVPGGGAGQSGRRSRLGRLCASGGRVAPTGGRRTCTRGPRGRRGAASRRVFARAERQHGFIVAHVDPQVRGVRRAVLEFPKSILKWPPSRSDPAETLFCHCCTT